MGGIPRFAMGVSTETKRLGEGAAKGPSRKGRKP
jgi:hypothetical protein